MLTASTSLVASRLAQPEELIDVRALLAAYAAEKPDPSVASQRVQFGTSGHRGSALDRSFNEIHVWAITQAICDYRKMQGFDGPLFLGVDTHAVSEIACASVLEVLAANGVNVMLSKDGEYTPTPAVSLAILAYNIGRISGFADGIVVTPSHNPPRDGGLKYNPPHGGPAGSEITSRVGSAANKFIETRLADVQRMPFSRASKAATTHRYDFLNKYVNELDKVVDMTLIRCKGVRVGVDPMGGAGIHYWTAIAERYGLDLTLTNNRVDPTFRFVPLDWDGQIRMDPSSNYVMQPLVAISNRFEVSFACDTDHDRHGIVTERGGLMQPNHYLAVAIEYLFQHRPEWNAPVAIGKTVVCTSLIDHLAKRLGRRLYEVPVGFKWFAGGLLSGTLGFCGEESAGATFLRRDGRVWTTDKDGIAAALLSAEIVARRECDLGDLYVALTTEFGDLHFERIDAAATESQKKQLAALSPTQIDSHELAGETIESVIDRAPGNGELIGGIRLSTRHGWFAARPSGTEAVYKIYAESSLGDAHLTSILEDAKRIVEVAIAPL